MLVVCELHVSLCIGIPPSPTELEVTLSAYPSVIEV